MAYGGSWMVRGWFECSRQGICMYVREFMRAGECVCVCVCVACVCVCVCVACEHTEYPRRLRRHVLMSRHLNSKRFKV